MEWIYETLLYGSLLFILYKIRLQRRKEKALEESEKQLEHQIVALSAAYSKYHNMEDALFQVQQQEKVTSSTYAVLLEQLCQMVVEIGDRKRNGSSVFQMNLAEIRDEIRGDLLYRQKSYYLFLGLPALCIIPFFTIPILTWWASNVSNELGGYYEGRFAVITITIAYLITVASYLFLSWLQFPGIIKSANYDLERRLLKNNWIRRGIDSRLAHHYAFYLKKNELLKQMQGFGNIKEFELRKQILFLFGVVACSVFFIFFTGINKNEAEELLRFPELYTLSVEKEDTERINEKMREQYEAVIEGKLQIEEVAVLWEEYPEEVSNTVLLLLQQADERRRAAHFKFFYAFISLFAGGIGYCIPEVFLRMQMWHVREEKMEEMQRIQIVIMVQIQDAEMTVEQLLEAMEAHAVLFKSAMEEAVDHFSFGQKEAINRLIEQTAYQPMERICERFYICEEAGIEEGFADFREERHFFLQKNQQEKTAALRERAALARAIAYLPFLSVLVLKLIVPFVAEGLSQLSLYGQGINTFF